MHAHRGRFHRNKRVGAKCRLSLAIVTSLFAAAAFAQQDPPDKGEAEGEQKKEVLALQSVTVTASKRAEQVSDVAGAVSAVTAEELDRLSATKLEDYASFVPGLTLTQTNRSMQTVVIRGIAPQMSSSTTAIYVDDVPVGSASNEADGSLVIADLDPGDLQRVEVLKGPQGTLYGASSLGGVLKYVTREPDLDRYSYRVSAGTYGVRHGDIGHELRASANLPLVDEKLAVRVGGYTRKDAGYIREVSSGDRNVNGGTAEGGRVSLLYAPSDNWRIRMNAMSSELEYDGDNDVDIDPATGKPAYGDLSRRDWVRIGGNGVNFDLYTATIEHYLKNGGTLTSATGYSTQHSDYRTDISRSFIKTALGLSEEQGLMAHVGVDTDRFTQEVRWTSPARDRFEWMLGGFYQEEESTLLNFFTALEADQTSIELPNIIHDVQSKNRLREAAAFVNATYYFTPSVDMTLGYRLSHIEQNSQSKGRGLFTTPDHPNVYQIRPPGHSEGRVSTYLASLRWHLTDDLMLYGRAASGYRPGGSRNRPAGAPEDFRTMYDSDSVWNYEVGLKASSFDGRLATDLTAFWIDWEDIQQAVIVNTFFVTGNGGKARSRGLEASARALVSDHLTLTANAAYTDAIFLEDSVSGLMAGQRIPGVPQWSGAIGAEYAIPLGGGWSGFFGGDYRQRSDVLTVDRFRIDGHQVLGVHAGAQHGGLRINLYVKNLNDERAYTAASATATNNPLPMVVLQPRTIGLTVTAEF